MKIFLTISLIFLITFSTKAQDIIVKNLDKEITTNFQNSKSETFQIQNYSNLDKSIKIKTKINNLQGGATLQICYGENCQESTSFLIVNVPANSISNEISIVLNGGLSNYKETAYFEFIDMEVDQGIKKEIMLNVSNERTQELFFSKNDVQVKSFFPNPTVKSAIMEYSINSGENDAKITLQNVLGSIVSTYELSPEENKLTISTEDLNPGVYFYTLTIDDEGLATRKLIVKK
ncbi:T9SS type A sorting domain-containing protein [Marivirga salinae]|uniref:T9SS type A sorting domain-containing protein n=1 Tax=Marivirga salinarum TaxID=3059078 RepID=A0AA49GFU2_9BACT|nr:T9SS type A sorting domain-containing protein [Marivirga sp. BDSF4-3]WKK73475.2 T9SS type A sorting domain-containing protein [Marivirga sp. BDSF4-3]